jgi:hypothetical protein
MTMPLDNQQNRTAPDDRLFDRLVDGELPDRERRVLLQRLEAQPDGWRRCALAFLEAQAWRASFGMLAGSGGAIAERSTIPAPTAQAVPTRGALVGRLLGMTCALAACAALAFALGWTLRPKPAGGGADVSVATTNPPAATATPPQAIKLDAASATAHEVAASNRKEPVPLDELLKKWEQRGYRAERQDRVVPVELKNGRKVNLPVQEYRFQYMGGRTY